MYSRILKIPEEKSFFLFGPRATGKTTWINKVFPKGIKIDLLESELYTSLLASPGRLAELIPDPFDDWVILDEIQRVPELLNEVHRLIEQRRLKFVLTGSSARKLRAKGVNLLAGRALTRLMHPLTAAELENDFSLDKSLMFGHLPPIYSEKDPSDYLAGYVRTYLREEVQQEGLTRNLQAFSRFLEASSFSQASTLNISEIARDCNVNRKLAEEYFYILEDLLLAHRIPVFTKRAKRRMAIHPKFFLFDVGVYRTIRPKGPLDRNDFHRTGYNLYYWITGSGHEVDFILYGEKGLIGIEIKRAAKIRNQEFKGLKAFSRDYPMAALYMFYGGDKKRLVGNVELIPIKQAIVSLPDILRQGGKQ
ncbi:MAG: ATP-binding protein [Deltaproteobacteria bacterium]|nr:ATP-binding protein [Deltaproteobacteria bacterium]